jgi:crotonobetainyl-CoA:carnitine CoA-transferase CaiB-like acyl-CoA transferase
MRNFSLDYPVLKEINPGIVMISLSGYGQTGPWANWGGYGFVLEYVGGITTITGYRDTPPTKIGISYTDPWSGVLGAGAVAMALRQRRYTGRGQYIDLSQRDVAPAFIGEAMMDHEMNGRVWGIVGNRHPSMAPHGCYHCKGEDNERILEGLLGMSKEELAQLEEAEVIGTRCIAEAQP